MQSTSSLLKSYASGSVGKVAKKIARKQALQALQAEARKQALEAKAKALEGGEAKDPVHSPTSGAGPAPAPAAAPVAAKPASKPKNSSSEPPAYTPKTDTSKAETSKAQTPQAETSKAKTPKAEAAEAKTCKAEANKGQSFQTETTKGQSPKAENTKAKNTKADASKAETAQQAAPKADADKTKTAKVDAAKAEAADTNTLAQAKAKGKPFKISARASAESGEATVESQPGSEVEAEVIATYDATAKPAGVVDAKTTAPKDVEPEVQADKTKDSKPKATRKPRDHDKVVVEQKIKLTFPGAMLDNAAQNQQDQATLSTSSASKLKTTYKKIFHHDGHACSVGTPGPIKSSSPRNAIPHSALSPIKVRANLKIDFVKSPTGRWTPKGKSF